MQLALPRTLARRWQSPAIRSAWTADLCGHFAGTSHGYVKNSACSRHLQSAHLGSVSKCKVLCMQVAALRARDAALQQALAERNIDNVELRRQLAAARQAADPHIAQARLPAASIALLMILCIAVATA